MNDETYTAGGALTSEGETVSAETHEQFMGILRRVAHRIEYPLNDNGQEEPLKSVPVELIEKGMGILDIAFGVKALADAAQLGKRLIETVRGNRSPKELLSLELHELKDWRRIAEIEAAREGLGIVAVVGDRAESHDEAHLERIKAALREEGIPDNDMTWWVNYIQTLPELYGHEIMGFLLFQAGYITGHSGHLKPLIVEALELRSQGYVPGVVTLRQYFHALARDVVNGVDRGHLAKMLLKFVPNEIGGLVRVLEHLDHAFEHLS